MINAIARVPVWIWLVLAAIFILIQAATCFAFNRSETFWNKQSCGFKEVELDQGNVPEKIWNKVTQLLSQSRSCFSVEQVDGRVFSFCVKYNPHSSSYRVRSIKISKGGEVIYSSVEKVCQ